MSKQVKQVMRSLSVPDLYALASVIGQAGGGRLDEAVGAAAMTPRQWIVWLLDLADSDAEPSQDAVTTIDADESEKRRPFLRALAGMPEEAFGWVIAFCANTPGRQIFPDGRGGFRDESRTSIAQLEAAARAYMAQPETCGKE